MSRRNEKRARLTTRMTTKTGVKVENSKVAHRERRGTPMAGSSGVAGTRLVRPRPYSRPKQRGMQLRTKAAAALGGT